MKEFHQRRELSLQDVFLSAPSKKAKLADATLFLVPFSYSLSSLLVVVFSFVYFSSQKASHANNITRNCTDLGQRLISLSPLTNRGLRVSILLAFGPLWFNITPPDMTPHNRQRLCNIFGFTGQRDGGRFCKAHQSFINN